MPKLDEYRKKRDFSATPEPGPALPTPHEGLLYVIQKHAASHLHFDFRIELDGVLLSWAVPKGPSLDPADKRLAMHVEDHPVAYGGFEGTIPKGEYGGGTVMLWDRGTWEPDHGDPREHLAQGHLKFELHGERLRGRWMLVRTKGYGGKNPKESWLLFKEHDREERPRAEFDAVAEWTTSVLSGRSMEQIAGNEDAVWHSDRSVAENLSALSSLRLPEPVRHADPEAVGGARKATMPRSIDVQLAMLVKGPPQGDAWLHEVKLDGYRIVAFLSAGKARLVSRNGHDWTARFEPVARAIEALDVDNAVIDGEMVVLKPDGTSDFQALQNFAKSGQAAHLEYYAFDLLHLNGHDVRGAPLEERKRLLRGVVPAASESLRYTDHVEGHGDEFFGKACEYALEGVVSKRRTAPYRPGRNRDWLKAKCLLQQEFVVVGWTDPQGARKDFGALVLGLHRDGAIVRAGRVGTGFTEASLRDIMSKLRPLQCDEAPVVDPPKGSASRSIHWVEPKLVAEVAFSEWTEDGVPRHPSFIALREDKPAEEVREEKPLETPPPEPETNSESSSSVAGVRLTNPDRVLWPDVPLTKMEAARYYEAVAELMAPHVAERPLSLVRCPTGYTGECFYQKHIENFPQSVGTVDVYEPDEGRSVPYATVRDAAGLVGLIQMGVLEIHIWGSRNDRMERPDRLVFDLDPDPDLPFEALSGTALLLRSELGRLGLQAWLKGTGGKGLHVVVPVRRTLDFDGAKSFARAFVDSIVRMEPALFTANMSKSQREGRIYIDYLRNSMGATSIAPFSTRARPGAPVALPLYWEEIEDGRTRPEFTVRDVPSRLASLGGDPWEAVGASRQAITRDVLARLGVE